MENSIYLKNAVIGMPGVSVTAHGIRICAELYGKEKNGILLYPVNGGKIVRLDFTPDMRTGNTFSAMLAGCNPSEYTYLFHEDGKPVMDIFAKAHTGHRRFGQEDFEQGVNGTQGRGVFVTEDFDWKKDKMPGTAYEDSVYYGMHLRGFTMSESARMKEAGTFAGMQKKIPYLKRLGVTGVVLQPIYEFQECMREKKAATAAEAVEAAGKKEGFRLNYWGYLPGLYMAPKNAYAYGEDAVTELKTLVRALHKNGLELMLQFYFEPGMRTSCIRDILLYWIRSYHIDGFWLMGADLPLKELLREPCLSETKLWSDSFWPEGSGTSIERKKQYLPAFYDRGYAYTVRRFLKGDGDMLPGFLQYQRNHPQENAVINFLAGYDGFRLADVVSYNGKHNEANGEDNRDGENNNDSWNCGVEGATRKKSVLALRTKQIKNALAMLFTAQGTPFLFMGDEWGKSGGGNNNPYCQDNEVTWQKWNLKKSEKELLEYTRGLIAFRKAQGVLHQKKQLRIMDYLSYGYPDISYHGQEAWKADLSYASRSIGVMLCGKYCPGKEKSESSLYMAYNMYWEPREFALPKPDKGGRWELVFSTEGAEEGERNTKSADKSLYCITVPGRCVQIYREVSG